MLQMKNPTESTIQQLENLGMSTPQYDLWKETVRIDAIQLPKHAYHWVADS